MNQLVKKRKILTTLTLIATFMALTVPLLAFAQGYVPLAPVPPASSEGQHVNFPNYVRGMIKLLIGVAGVLAVIVIIIGGIQYITAGDSESRKGDAKERIWKAIIGLILALASWLILYTINPDLVIVDITVDPASAPGNSGFQGTPNPPADFDDDDPDEGGTSED
jgi:amino acid transporter